MQTKICYSCKKEFELNETNFARHIRKKDGFQAQCRECQKEYKKNHYDQNKQKYVDKAKRNKEKSKRKFLDWLKDKQCADCGNNDIRVLEFDHVRGEKEYNISQKAGLSLEVLLKEIEKCDIVCANCHRIRTCTRGNFLKNKIIDN